MEGQLVGRSEPLAQLDRFVDGLAAAAGSLVIEGEAGIGKTTVWQAAVERARIRGYRLLVCHPAQAESGLAYSGLTDLLAGADDHVLAALPAPQRVALEVALLRAEPTDGDVLEPQAVFSGFGGVLHALAQDVPVLVAVDDRQWLDRSSQKALSYLARRLGDSPIGMLATARPEGGSWTADETTLRLGPLSPGAIYQLLKTQLGVSLPRPAVLRVHTATGGNPFFALQLGAVLAEAGLPDPDEPWPVPDDLRELVRARLDVLPARVRAALLVAAARAQSTVAGLSRAALHAAEQAQIVSVGADGQVRFAHPLLAAAIYESASARARRRVHARLAADSDDLEERARHAALACDGADAQVAELLEQAAVSARARGAPEVAAELAERSAALTPAANNDMCWERRLRAAEYHFHAGDRQRARTVLLPLVVEPAAPARRSRALRILGETCRSLGLIEESLSFLREAVDAAEGDADSAARAELALAQTTIYTFGSFAEAAAGAARALAFAEAFEDGDLLATALADCVFSDVILGRGLDEERLQRALRLEDLGQAAPIEQRPSILAAMACLQSEQYERVQEILEPLRARLVAGGEESDLPGLLATLAFADCFAGNLAVAGEHAEDAYRIARQSGSDTEASLARGSCAVVYAHQGRVEETRAAAAEAFELAARSGSQAAAFWGAVALGLLELSLGNDAAVVQTLARSIELVERDGVVEPNRRPFLGDAIEAFVHLGDLERADRLTTAFEESAHALQQRAATIAAARCRALIHAARGDPATALAGLGQTLAATPNVPKPLELARALTVKGQLERRCKDKRNAVASLHEALTLCEEIGATLWAERARSELARLGRTRDANELTATQAQIAELAANGLSNREIAAAAFISQKTVEANMTRIYRKLGIHSRAELAHRITERNRAADSNADAHAHVLL